MSDYHRQKAIKRLGDIIHLLWVSTTSLESRCQEGDILDKVAVESGYNILNDVGYTIARPHWEKPKL